jgi:uncharacterized protein
MKPEVRLLGVDDGPFHFSDKETAVIGVVMRASGYIEGIIKKEIRIDGSDATNLVIDMITHTRHRKQLKAMMLDGVALGGFNIVDIDKVFDETSLPVVTVTRDKPNFEKIKTALQGHFEDWKDRYDLITRGELFELETSYNPIFVKCAGVSFEEAKEIITLATIRGVIPEPIRIAHIIASGILRGESYGKA